MSGPKKSEILKISTFRRKFRARPLDFPNIYEGPSIISRPETGSSRLHSSVYNRVYSLLTTVTYHQKHAHLHKRRALQEREAHWLAKCRHASRFEPMRVEHRSRRRIQRVDFLRCSYIFVRPTFSLSIALLATLLYAVANPQ